MAYLFGHIAMPYNTTAIPPRREVTGQTQLPCKRRYVGFLHGAAFTDTGLVSRVKKIIAVDPDVNICSNNAAFAITLATVSHPLIVKSVAFTYPLILM